jgi:thiol:disulfide interchange protein DsbA
MSMKSITRWFSTLLATALLSGPLAAAEFSEGEQYLRLSNPQPTSAPDKIEVVELFWYGCPHCYDLEPHIQQWLETKPDDVVFVRLPAIFRQSWELLAKAFFTAELLGVQDKVHPALFHAIHDKNQKFDDEAAVQDLFREQGVPEEEFRNTFGSFAVSVKLNNAKLMTRRYAITGVPTLIVNGKFSTGGPLAGSNANIIKVVDYLVAKERSGMAPVAKSAQP